MLDISAFPWLLVETSIRLSSSFAHISCHTLTGFYSRLIRSGRIFKTYHTKEEHSNSARTEQGTSDSVCCGVWSSATELDGHDHGHWFMVGWKLLISCELWKLQRRRKQRGDCGFLNYHAPATAAQQHCCLSSDYHSIPFQAGKEQEECDK